jgi:hypothetical protein
MKKMGTTQPGLPWINFVPAGYAVKILDLKDCFFTIPLHPKDQERFAFPVPTNNNTAPCAQYQWTVLPQGMKNSPNVPNICFTSLTSLFRSPTSLNSLYG